MRKVLTLLLLLLSVSCLVGQEITGQWNGLLKVQGAQLRVVFHITKTAAGYSATMDSPDQGASGIPVTSATFVNNQLKLIVPALKMEYAGELAGKFVKGTFTQGGMSIPMDLAREESPAGPVVKEAEDKNAPFSESPMELATPTGKLYGTFTTPKQFQKGPVALIIAGSGPTDRDCNNPMMKCDAYKKLARELAEKGIASLRYDKRGIGESKAALKSEAEIRFDDYVSDARGWVQQLKKDARFTKVIVIGHSEGSLIGMLAVAGADKFVSIAGAGQSGDKILKIQLSNIPAEYKDISYNILDNLKNGKTVDPVDPKLNNLFRASVQPYLISWFKYDPQQEIAGLKLPILLIQGTSDIQVTTDDANLLAKANPKATLKLVDNMNHVLRSVTGDRQANIATYNNPSLPLSDGLVTTISGFILKN
jgi:pimeloyl-ACP methyl ester carboxylesterase